MSNKLDHGASPGAGKDPFAQLSQIIKKKALYDDNAGPVQNPTIDVADPAPSQSTAAPAANPMSHYSEQAAPIAPPFNSQTGADREREQKRKSGTNSRRMIDDPQKPESAAKADEPSKTQSHE